MVTETQESVCHPRTPVRADALPSDGAELAASIHRLAQALGEPLIGRERLWAARVRAALQQVLTTLRSVMAASQAARAVGPWRHEQFQLLEQTCALRRRTGHLLEAFASPPYTVFSQVLEDGAELVRALRRHHAERLSQADDGAGARAEC